MSRRIYIDTATMLRDCRPRLNGHDLSNPRRGMWCTCVEAVADAFARSNRAFDKQRFLLDCGFSSPNLPSVTPEDAQLLLRHAKKLGRAFAEFRLLDAGAQRNPHTAVANLASVPPENLASLREALKRDLEE